MHQGRGHSSGDGETPMFGAPASLYRAGCGGERTISAGRQTL